MQKRKSVVWILVQTLGVGRHMERQLISVVEKVCLSWNLGTFDHPQNFWSLAEVGIRNQELFVDSYRIKIQSFSIQNYFCMTGWGISCLPELVLPWPTIITWGTEIHQGQRHTSSTSRVGEKMWWFLCPPFPMESFLGTSKTKRTAVKVFRTLGSELMAILWSSEARIVFSFQAHMKFPNDYPYSPPTVRFLTKMWHPNVYEVTVEQNIPAMCWRRRQFRRSW